MINSYFDSSESLKTLKNNRNIDRRMWKLCALLSALFAALTAIFAKIGVKDIDSNLATAIRTSVILLLTWGIVFASGHFPEVKTVPRYTWIFLVLSGLATGLSWLFYFKAIQLGDVSRVAPIDKLSVVFTILLSFFILKESLTPRVIAGGLLITAGALVMIWKDDIEIEADEIGIVYPIYGHMPPNMVRQFIKKAKLKADYKFAILTYGNRKCNAVEIWDKISRDAGVPFDYINTLIMVDNWLPNFDMNEQVLIDKHIPENLEKIRADIYDRKSWHEPVSEEERMQHQGFIIILLHRKVSRLRGTANFVLPAYRIVPRKLSSL